MPGETSTRGTAMAQARIEKQVMDKKVAAVREVVKNASNNDLVLVLQSFEGDVERTIQAFMEDGAKSALETWSTGGSGKGGKKKNRRKGGAGRAENGTHESVSPLPPPTFTPSTTTAAPFLNGTAGGPSLSNNHSAPKGGSSSGHSLAGPRVESSTSRSSNGVQRGRRAQSPPLAESNNKLSNNHHVPPHPSGNGARDRPVSISSTSSEPQNKKKALEKEIKNMARHDAMISRVQTRFNEEMDKAQDRMRRSFTEVRAAVKDRESYLTSELARCKEDGHRLLTERVLYGRELHKRSERLAVMSDKEIDDLRTEIKRFVGERKLEEEFGSTVRYSWEPDTILNVVKNFGEVSPVKPFLAHKHSSQQSLVSSVGEDSGLGLTSPVSPDDKKSVAQVESGGIVMKSESLTTEQLQDLNRRLQESLSLQGITQNILSGIAGGAPMPAKRPNPNRGGGRGGRGGRGGGRGGRGRGASGPPEPELTLSIS